MTDAVLEARNLSVTYRLRRRGWFGKPQFVHALSDASFALGSGETLGLVGESGSGKSTTGRATIGLVPSTGTLRFNGREVDRSSREQAFQLRRDMQIVFQDPYSSLDPTMKVGDIVAEPLAIHQSLSRTARRAAAEQALEQVGLEARRLNEYPSAFSGGQRQRIAIARAIILNPAYIVFDEAVSGLDASTKNQILDLVRDLQLKTGASYLFISHDLAVVRNICHRIAVMYAGRIVELGPAHAICSKPAHPYTAALLSAIPIPDPELERQRPRVFLSGEPPSPFSIPPGCPFHQRCPAVMEKCRHERPPTFALPGHGAVACHLHESTAAGVVNIAPKRAHAPGSQ